MTAMTRRFIVAEVWMRGKGVRSNGGQLIGATWWQSARRGTDVQCRPLRGLNEGGAS